MSGLTGSIHVFHLFEVAETIDLRALRDRFGPSARLATLTDKTPGPSRLRYIEPPVILDGGLFDIPEIAGFALRVKFYDYGVVSLGLTRPFSGAWADLVAAGQGLAEDDRHGALAEDAARSIAGRTSAALRMRARAGFLSEDYLVFALTSVGESVESSAILTRHGADIAQLLRGERQPLSRQEVDEVLKPALSYLSTDLVIPAWSAAFVYDRPEETQVALEVLEFANSQLLEFRFHDAQLELELAQIYADVQRRRWIETIIGRRYRRAIGRLHSLFIDVNELTDRTENALKFVGDQYAARLFVLAGSRLRLDDWKRNVQDKLKTLDDIYRFAVEETSVSQGNMLELIIVLILVFELFLSLTGLFGS
jgi:hypothetical protein